MKIAIPSTTSDMNGEVEQKLGTAAYLLVVETDDMSFEVMAGPPLSAGPGAGGHISLRLWENEGLMSLPVFPGL